MVDLNSDNKEESGKRKRLEDDDKLALTLSFVPPPPPPSPPPPLHSIRASPLSLTHQPDSQLNLANSNSLLMPPIVSDFLKSIPYQPRIVNGGAVSSRRLRTRQNPHQAPGNGKSDTIPAPFPWATTRRATVYSLENLLSKQIFFISGEVQCKKCEQQFEIQYDLRQKYIEIGSFIAQNKIYMHDRAPVIWKSPILPGCRVCKQENIARPIIARKKKSINWLFLLLGQMLGCCTLEQLKYFCKHTKNHRTGAKDRVLYLAYLGLCKQLDPNGPFDR